MLDPGLNREMPLFGHVPARMPGNGPSVSRTRLQTCNVST